MPRPITAITEPMQLHAEGCEVENRGGVLRMAPQQADRGKTKALARRRQCMQMVGVGTAETHHSRGACVSGLGQVLGELEPLVAADQRIDTVQAQHGQLDAVQPIQLQRFKGRVGQPVERTHVGASA